MKIKSTRFGELDIPAAAVLSFPHGLPGFNDEKEFAFIPYQADSPFAFLQSMINPDLTLMVVEPFTFFPDYKFEIDDQTLGEFGLADDNPPQVFNVVRIPEQLAEMTANLLAPVLINWRDRRAGQIVLEKTGYTVRHRLFPRGLPKANDQGGR